MNEDPATRSALAEQDIARGVEMIGEGLPEVATRPLDDGAEDMIGADEDYPPGLFGAIIATVREEPLRALAWAAGVGTTIWLLTSK